MDEYYADLGVHVPREADFKRETAFANDQIALASTSAAAEGGHDLADAVHLLADAAGPTERPRQASVRSFGCNSCELSFLSLPELREHVRSHAQSAERPFRCGVCGRTYKVGRPRRPPAHLQRGTRTPMD
jgi:hypothetical protein